MKLIAAALLGLAANAHQSFNGGEGFAPHWETPAWTNKDDPTNIGFRLAKTNHNDDLVGATQDDNYMNKDDDRRVYAPAYDDHHSYQHHPTAHQYSDEHFMDDEGQSTRVIHGQDTTQHVNRRSKKKVFDTIKEPKHHFAVQTIDVPFPMHHHYYNHTKVHYHDGYDLYDDDVGDSEKYYHVNPDTHTNVNGWFADDHYRMSNGGGYGGMEQFDNDGEAIGYDDAANRAPPRDEAPRDDGRDENDGRDDGRDDARDDGRDDNRDAMMAAAMMARRGDDGRNDDGRDDTRDDGPYNHSHSYDDGEVLREVQRYDDGYGDDGDDGDASGDDNMWDPTHPEGVVVNTYFVGDGADADDTNGDDNSDDNINGFEFNDNGDDTHSHFDDSGADDAGDHHTHVYVEPHTMKPHFHEAPERRPLITLPMSEVMNLMTSASDLAKNAFASIWSADDDSSNDRRRIIS